MNTHLNGKVIASVAIATAALGALGTLAAIAYKKRIGFGDKFSLPDYPHTVADELLSNVEPGEISPKVDTPTDPANQN